MRRLYLPLVVLLGITACSAPAKQEAAPQDRNAPALEPAVISVPLNVPVPVGDAATGSQASLIPADSMQRVFVVHGGYGLVTAMMINQDGRALTQMYAPTSVLHLPDSSIAGNTDIVRALLSLAQSKSLSDFQRTSLGMRTLDDSTIADSGRYVMTLKRPQGTGVQEHGKYATTWRARRDATKWVILEDRIQPTAAPRQKAGKKAAECVEGSGLGRSLRTNATPKFSASPPRPSAPSSSASPQATPASSAAR